MRKFKHYFLTSILEHLRQPTYIVSTLAFPAVFYVIFAIPESKNAELANFLMASFSAFAVFGVVFLQLGVSLAQDRISSWQYFLKTLPASPLTLVVARFLSALFFALLAVLVIVALAVFFTPAELDRLSWFKFFAWTLGLAPCFSAMGFAFGYWSKAKSSLPLGNLIYLPLTFAGGLWKPPEILPKAVQDISHYLPTRHYGEILWASVKNLNIPEQSLWNICFYTLAFSMLGYLGIRKDYQTRKGS